MELIDYIKSNFSYDPKTGLIRRFDRANSCGSKDHYGYLILKIKGKQYKYHRVAWLLHYGSFPCFVIDHINGIRDDNRICNLREVTQHMNSANRNCKPNKDTGEIGVYIDRTIGLKKKYAVKINGTTKRFSTITEAKKYRQNEIRKINQNSDRIKGSKKSV